MERQTFLRALRHWVAAHSDPHAPRQPFSQETVLVPGSQIQASPRRAGSRSIEQPVNPQPEQPGPAAAARTRSSKPRPASRSKAQPVEDKIDWGDQEQLDLSRLVGVEDAFEHTPLLAGESIAYCQYDRVAYHLSTWEFLKTVNNGRCCSCGKLGTITILSLPGVPVPAPAPPALPGKLPKPAPTWQGLPVIGRKDVGQYVGRAVVVQDYVHEVYETRSTGAFFIRFDRRQPSDPPFKGFKVVIRPGYVRAWRDQGLAPKAYQGKTIRVRGIIHDDPDWDIEILVNSPLLIEVVGESQEGA